MKANAASESPQNPFLDESPELDRAPSAEELTGPPNGQGGWVIVEPNYFETMDDTGHSLGLLPYRERRGKWGYNLSLGYSFFVPTNYEPTVGPYATYNELYSDSANSPLLEFQFSFLRHFGLGSLGLEAAAGIYSNDSRISDVESTLDITKYRVGLTLILDTLFTEPWVAPYISGGGYVIQKKESSGSVTDNENTQVAPYYSFGLNFQLDWIDSDTAIGGYSELGLQNTYLFVEGRQLIESSAEADSNFGTDIFLTAGLRLEL